MIGSGAGYCLARAVDGSVQIRDIPALVEPGNQSGRVGREILSTSVIFVPGRRLHRLLPGANSIIEVCGVSMALKPGFKVSSQLRKILATNG